MAAVVQQAPAEAAAERRSGAAARAVRGSGRDAQAEAAQRPQPLRPAVVRDHRRARVGQDDGARQLRAEVSARAARRARARCAASAARATATGGSPTKRCSSTPPAATRRRIPTRASDSAGWAEFLALLRKYRKRRPVNGVILTISAQDLMMQGDRGARGARRGGAPAAERAESRAAHPAAGLPDGHQVRPGRRLHRVLRRPGAGGPRAGLGRHVPVRADAQRRGARRRSRRSSTR